jgi:hypothetical protein
MQRPVIVPSALVWLVASGCATTPQPSLVPPQSVDMEAETLHQFQEGIREYVELREGVLKEIPHTPSQATPEQQSAHKQALTDAIVANRKGARRGRIFKPPVEAAIRRTLKREFSGPDGAALLAAIKQGNPEMEGNPKPQDPSKVVMTTVVVAVNGVYADAAPSSSMPPSLLLQLPPLPPGVRYRFVGPTLILYDNEANVILDFMANAVRMAPTRGKVRRLSTPIR